MKDLVSIIIPCFNHGNIVTEAIESCINQTYRNIEILLIDDGSTDNTEELYLEKYDGNNRVHYFKQENFGLASARNFGLKMARGKFIQFLDADDIIFKRKIEIQIELIEKYNVSAVHSDFFCTEGNTNKRIEKYASPETNENHFLHDLILKWEKGLSIPCHCFLFRRWSFHNLQFNKELETHEDWEFYARWASMGNYSIYINLELCIYRIFPKSLSRDEIKMETGFNKAINEIANLSEYCKKLVEERESKY